MNINRNKIKRNSHYYIIRALLLIFIIFVFFAIVRSFQNFRRYKEKYTKLIVTSQLNKGDVEIYVLDFVKREINVISIPGDVSVELPGNLGYWKIRNVWKIGENEGISGGIFLQKTLLSNFGWPVASWAETDFSENIHKEKYFSAVFKTTISQNVSLINKFQIYSLLSDVQVSGMNKIDIMKTSYIDRLDNYQSDDNIAISSIDPPDYFYGIFKQRDLDGLLFRIITVEDVRTKVVKNLSHAINLSGGILVSTKNTEKSGGSYACFIKVKDAIILRSYPLEYLICDRHVYDESLDVDIEVYINQ